MGRGGLIGYFVRHGTAANLLLAVMVVLGLAAAVQMRAQFFPDIVLDDVRVTVRWDGAGPEDVDRAVVAPLLPALQAVDGVEETDSVARDGTATISLEFEPGWDMARALDAVQTAVDSVSDLPEDADRPEVTRREWRDRVTDVVLTGPVGVDQLARFTDAFVLRLFEIGVTRTTISGIADPEIRITVPTANLIRYDMTLSQIASAVTAQAGTAPSGSVAGADARLRSGTARREAGDIAAIVLRSAADGSSLTVGDVAQVEIGGTDRVSAYFVGKQPAISLRVDRSARGDAIALQRQVEELAADFTQTLPDGVTVDLVRTRADAISDRLNILLDNGLTGLALVVGLLFLFLNARAALWVAAGIPVAMCAAIAVMYAAGLSLNMISLFGLILTLGIVVDDAIVVAEHADFRSRTLGESPTRAAETAARRMALPVFSAALTTIIAFWGLTAIGGRFGAMVFDIPVTVVAVLAASLVECFLILPAHMRHALAASRHDAWYDWPSRQVNRGFGWVRERVFRPLMRLVIAARYPILAGLVALLTSQALLLMSGEVPWRFFNAPERGSITGNFVMTSDATRADTMAQMRELQRAADVVAADLQAQHGRNPLDYVLAKVGGTTGRGLASADEKDPDLQGSISIELIGADLRPYSSFEVLRLFQDEVERLPRTEELSFRSWRAGPGGDALDVQLFGTDTGQLKAAAETLKRELSTYPEVSALQDTMPWDKREITLDLTPRAQVLGFSIDTLGRVLRDRLTGIEALSFPDGPRTGTIRVEVPEGEATADFLERVRLRAPSGQYLPLADLVTWRAEPGFASIRRENGLRTVSVNGDLSEDDPTRAAQIMETLETEILPRIEEESGVGWRLAGLAEQESDFLSDASIGFTLCLLGIFMTLAWVFASWTRPLVIMAVIPFGLIGTIWGHYIWDVPLSMFSVVGLIGMTGIIINDSIVLITTIDSYARTRGLRPAIVDAVCDRLRPVLLTTLTTVLGLAPLLYETSRDAQFLKPTVITLVYGLGFGMVLVLIMVPALLASGQDVSRCLRAARRALFGRARGATVASLSLSVLLALWGGATLGAQATLGRMLVSVGRPEVGMGGAFVIFAIGVILMTLAALLVVSMLPLMRRRGQSA
ncbi:efflux RND transporter permease subunit [Meridianimarinicoccus aquatilis]|uniref:Efflux RND transporter permease subunit n=1 Tax=Meridianimarinicoccus aquatilis TaxID=2552766 RepID=A0A4R6AWM2_9RHOB|nr:efflux RND transporter permease subunit [Fluviibacterium aquatile]TDL88085.1 efflux RND transporter permease subunit [Fluviibacterium aquatile]